MKEKEFKGYSIHKEVDQIAGETWGKLDPTTEFDRIMSKAQACFLADELVEFLTEHPSSNQQVANRVYLEQQEYFNSDIVIPRVGVHFHDRAISEYLGIYDAVYISFDTHPQYFNPKAERLRYLTIGEEVDVNGYKGIQQIAYIFSEDSFTKNIYISGTKVCRTENLLVSDVDELIMVARVLGKIQDGLSSLVPGG